MKVVSRYAVAVLLVLSAIILAIMVPGGPVETRSFSNISVVTLTLFNIFLTSLGIASLALSYFVNRRWRPAYSAAATCGLLYLLVYGLDLCNIFPVSLDRMPVLLFILEALGALISVPLVLLSWQLATSKGDECSDPIRIVPIGRTILGVTLLIAICIVVFATLSAMR